MNPQAKILNRYGLLNAARIEVVNILTAHRGITLSSSELLHLFNLDLQQQLANISRRYNPQCACGRAASYVGAVAAMEARLNPNVSHDRHHHCPVLNRYDDAFRM